MRHALQTLLLSLLCLAGSPGLSLAGTVCGTVRDALTSGPVAGAGVFVFHAGGGYAGFAGVTGAGGDFCIGDIPPGAYDLQVRVDNYLEKVIPGVIVGDAVSGVDVQLGTRLRLGPPRPNPARDRVTLTLELATVTTVDLQVFDIAGRLVTAWRTEDMPAGSHSVTWNFDDRDGNTIRPGLYLVRLSAPGSQAVRRVTFLGS